MGKILNAEFRRLFRERWFILTAAVIALLTVLFNLLDPLEANNSGVSFAANLMAFVPAVVIPNIIGKEYKDGTIRNKLICGCKRGALTGAYFIVSMAAVLIIYAVCLLVIGLFIMATGIGISSETLMAMANDITAVMLMSAICTMFSVIIQSKTGSVIASQVFAWGSVIVAYTFNSYERGTVLYSIIARLPFFQSLRYYYSEVYDYPGLDYLDAFALVITGSIALNVLIAVLFAAVTVLIFRRRDIK